MARLTLDDLLAKCSPSVRKLNPGLFHTGGASPASQPQPAAGPRPLAASTPEKIDSRKRFVRFTSYRVRLLDEDNLCPKYHCDALRYSGILLGDDPSKAKIETRQEKVAHKHQERTEITIKILLD